MNINPNPPDSEPDKNWFSDINLKATILSAALTIILSGGTSLGLMSAKIVSAEDKNHQVNPEKYITRDEFRQELKEFRAAFEKQSERTASRSDLENLNKIVLLIKESTDEQRKLTMQILEYENKTHLAR